MMSFKALAKKKKKKKKKKFGLHCTGISRQQDQVL